MFIKIDCECEWRPVNSQPGEPYKFQGNITSHMKTTYQIPAVYRWMIDKEEYYVGETTDLCKRIRNYLNAPKPKYNEAGKLRPHQQTTNIKMNARLHKSNTNCIQFLKFDLLQFGDATYMPSDLKNNHIRLLVEKMAIQDHVAKHLRLLNL